MSVQIVLKSRQRRETLMKLMSKFSEIEFIQPPSSHLKNLQDTDVYIILYCLEAKM